MAYYNEFDLNWESSDVRAIYDPLGCQNYERNLGCIGVKNQG